MFFENFLYNKFSFILSIQFPSIIYQQKLPCQCIQTNVRTKAFCDVPLYQLLREISQHRWLVDLWILNEQKNCMLIYKGHSSKNGFLWLLLNVDCIIWQFLVIFRICVNFIHHLHFVRMWMRLHTMPQASPNSTKIVGNAESRRIPLNGEIFYFNVFF